VLEWLRNSSTGGADRLQGISASTKWRNIQSWKIKNHLIENVQQDIYSVEVGIINMWTKQTVLDHCPQELKPMEACYCNSNV